MQMSRRDQSLIQLLLLSSLLLFCAFFFFQNATVALASEKQKSDHNQTIINHSLKIVNDNLDKEINHKINSSKKKLSGTRLIDSAVIFHKDFKRDRSIIKFDDHEDNCQMSFNNKKSNFRELDLGIIDKEKKIFRLISHYRIDLSQFSDDETLDTLFKLKDLRDLCLIKDSAKKLIKKLDRLNHRCLDQKNSCNKEDQKFLKRLATPELVMNYLEEQSFSIPRKNSGTLRPFNLYEKFQDVKAMTLTGKESFEKKYQAIKNAKTSISIEALDIFGDFTSRAIMELLIQKRKEGLSVRFIIDSLTMGQYGLSPLAHQQLLFKNANIGLRRMMASGVEVRGYACEGYKELLASISLRKPLSFLKRKHEKLTLIDRENIDQGKSRSFMGGMNVSNDYFEWSDTPYLDDDILVSGPIEKDLNQVFDENFEFFNLAYKKRGIKLSCINPFPPSTPEYEEFKNKHLKKFQYQLTASEIENENEIKAKIEEYHLEHRLDVEEMTNSQMRFYHSRPRLKEKAIRDLYIHLFNHAQKEIIIKNAYFLPSREIKRALINAVKRGIRVTIITNHIKTNKELWFTTVSGRLYYDELIAHGVKVFEWMGQTPSAERPQFYTLHSKLALIDNDTTVIGSYNLDRVSENWNSEDAMVIQSKKINKQMRKRIDDFQNFADPVSPPEAINYLHPQNPHEHFKYFIATMIGKILK